MSMGQKSLYQLLTANLVMALVITLRFQNLPPQIPLFYSNPIGEDQLTNTWFILLLPLLMNLLFFLNMFIFRRYFRNDNLILRMFYFLNLFIVASLTFVFAKIIFLVT